MNISIDVDGVLAAFTKAFVAQVNKIWPNKLPEDYQPESWYYTEVLNKQEMDFAFSQALLEPNFFLHLEPLPGARELRQALSALKRAGVCVYYITSRNKTAGLPLLVQTNTWLKDNELLTNNTATIVAGGGIGVKARINNLVDSVFSIDDKIETVRENNVDGIHQDHRSFLLDQRWNRSATTLPRVRSVGEFLEIVLAAAAQQEHQKVAGK